MLFFFFFFDVRWVGCVGEVGRGGGGEGHGNLHPTLFTQSNPYIYLYACGG